MQEQRDTHPSRAHLIANRNAPTDSYRHLRAN